MNAGDKITKEVAMNYAIYLMAQEFIRVTDSGAISTANNIADAAAALGQSGLLEEHVTLIRVFETD